MKPENEQKQAQDESAEKPASRRAFFTGATGVALAGTAAAASAAGSGSELKNRLMSRIQNELKAADESELHSYDKGDTAHSRYVKA